MTLEEAKKILAKVKTETVDLPDFMVIKLAEQIVKELGEEPKVHTRGWTTK